MTESTREDWRNTILAGLANYIDAGSIVAGSVALALWKDIYGLSDSFIGLIGAFSANAISAGIGALIGGILCDRFGRKKIYQYDMLFYAFGMMFLVFASAPWMIVLGFVLVGLAVGADIPASWSLIAEQAPDKKRGAHRGAGRRRRQRAWKRPRRGARAGAPCSARPISARCCSSPRCTASGICGPAITASSRPI